MHGKPRNSPRNFKENAIKLGPQVGWLLRRCPMAGKAQDVASRTPKLRLLAASTVLLRYSLNFRVGDLVMLPGPVTFNL
jgi:hypothetical protein